MTTITLPRAVVEQALKALLKSHTCPLLPDDCEAAIDALRAALAQPQGRKTGKPRNATTRLGVVCFEAYARSYVGSNRWDIAAEAVRAALAQQAEAGQDQRCRAEPRSDGDFVCDCKIGECPRRSAEPAQEPVAWKQGNLVTFNEDPYPALGGLFVQFWDGEEVAARVYANDLETIRQRCAKVNTAPPQQVAQQAEPVEPPGQLAELQAMLRAEVDRLVAAGIQPQRKPLTEEEIDALPWNGSPRQFARAIERAHGIGEGA